MYKIDIDKDNKLIKIELSGSINQDELKTYKNKVIDIVNQFNQKEVLILILMEKLDPLSQDCLNLCVEFLVRVSSYIKKIAFVHKRVVTRMQSDRIVRMANNIHGCELPSKSFGERTEALAYLFD